MKIYDSQKKSKKYFSKEKAKKYIEKKEKEGYKFTHYPYPYKKGAYLEGYNEKYPDDNIIIE